jgi:hypothetical protein
LLRHHGRGAHLLLLGLLGRALGENDLGLPLGVGVGHGVIRLGARRQGRRGGRISRRMVELGQQCFARVGRDRLDRSRPRAHAEPVEREHGAGRRLAADRGALEDGKVLVADDHGLVCPRYET